MNFDPSTLGYPSLFFIAFINQLSVPVPLDLIMLGMIKLGLNIWVVISIGIAGMTTGATVDYVFGRYGIRLIPWIRKEEKTKHFKRAERFFKNRGQITLIFNWVPFIGKYIPLIAGLMKTPPLNFFFFYILGKLLYYGAIFLLLSFTKIIL